MTDAPSYRMSCDIGGTFTDFVLVCDETGEAYRAKVLTTPDDPARAVIQGVEQLAGRVPGYLARTRRVIHGTTLVINALVQRRGAKTALLTTEGFRDVLAMRRHARAHIHQVAGGLPEPLIPRYLRIGVHERMLADGQVYRPLDPEEVRASASELVAQGVESIAVTFMHAYANAAHERTARTAISSVAPHVTVSLSSDVLPEIREYERTSTTVVNAYVQPVVREYLARLQCSLAERGFAHEVFLMQSAGGLTTRETAESHPVRLIESGPVGGVIAAQHFGAAAGCGAAVLAFDMGGTTAKACYVEHGRLPITSDFEVDRQYRFQKGSGTPVSVPTVDLTEIGAGGGSIAAINQLGLLQVGPQSAGADPGPVCYGRGGLLPTVTDADLLLGYLDPDYFLGGALPLDVDAAWWAVEKHVAEPLGLDVLRAAHGIHDLVNENMAAAIRAELANTGGDVTRAVLVATGGAGPVHAFDLATKLDVRRLLVPPSAGVGSALGLLLAPTSFEVTRSLKARLSAVDTERLAALLADMEGEAATVVAKADPDRAVRFSRFGDGAYVGQAHEVRFRLPEGRPSADAHRQAFSAAYHNQYGYSYADVDVELVTLRVRARLDEEARSGAPLQWDDSRVSREESRRQAYSRTAHDFVPHVVHHRPALGVGATGRGPAIIEEGEATIVVGGDGAFEVLENGAMLIRVESDE